ncbi:MAG: phosphoribosylamine--glycine ligase [Elusimicrobia bacterium]|nr:phosphoribosylamine--glycine ligase [Elusimicrobiota bacterium]
MKVLVVGSGGREHALVEKLIQSPRVKKIFCAPGNAGIAQHAECVPINADDIARLLLFVEEKGIDLTVVGPEVPLSLGIVDAFKQKKFAIFGPDKKSAQLEASKAFAKRLMKKYAIATARYESFTDSAAAGAYVRSLPAQTRLVVKADGLAGGKGVIICDTTGEALDAIAAIMQKKSFGAAGKEVVIEEFLEGQEASLQLFVDGKNYSLMPAAQDHKRIFDHDAGPNTGGMGAYAPAPLLTDSLTDKVKKTIIEPLIAGFVAEGIHYTGVLYIGLMIHNGIPSVLEFNCRFGDPETQVVLPLLKTDLIEIFEAVHAGRLKTADIQWHHKSAVCVVLAAKGYPGEYAKNAVIDGLDTAVAMKNVAVFHAGTAKNVLGETITAGGRVLGVTGTGSTTGQAITAAYQAVSCISFDGMQFRTDIGKKALS